MSNPASYATRDIFNTVLTEASKRCNGETYAISDHETTKEQVPLSSTYHDYLTDIDKMDKANSDPAHRHTAGYS